MSINPAKLLRLNEKGNLREGLDADIIIFNSNKKNIIDPKKFASKAKFSPYEGYEINGQITYSIVKGNIVYLNK